MSCCIYTTEAFIFKKRDIGEAGRLYSFFTKDFGRIDAVAQGVRHLKSKLRYHLSFFSFLRISFVATSGEYWRVVDAEEIRALESPRGDFGKARTIFTLFSLLDRLLQGQEADGRLWETAKELFGYLEKSVLSKNDLRNFEILFALRVLNHLGYAEDFSPDEPLSLEKVDNSKNYFLSLIKESLEHSQL